MFIFGVLHKKILRMKRVRLRTLFYRVKAVDSSWNVECIENTSDFVKIFISILTKRK